MEFPMHLLRLEQKIGKRLPVNPANLFASPGVMHVWFDCRDVCSAFRQNLPPESREFHAQPH
jgi:hypothetical protein